MTVYLVIDETDFGPIFSTKKKAEEYLGHDWKNRRAVCGYPDIEDIEVDDESFNRDR